jgi:hypothetical protein
LRYEHSGHDMRTSRLLISAALYCSQTEIYAFNCRLMHSLPGSTSARWCYGQSRQREFRGIGWRATALAWAFDVF